MNLLNAFPSFSSCSSPSSPATAFDATARCLAGIFRRILCYGSFPSYPSGHITEETSSVKAYKDQEFKSTEKTEEETETTATPSIVTRLMGLESIPDVNLVNSQSTPSSISRSKSMNSVDFAGGDDPMQAQRRRVKSTRSFRERPTFLELENEDFFLLSFENESKSKHKRSKGRKGELGYGEVKQRRAGKNKNSENRRTERERVRSRSSSDNFNGAVIDSTSTSISTNTIMKENTICDLLKDVEESECSSEDLSPVSVLDRGHQFLVDPEVPKSEEDLGNGLSSDARRTKTREGKCLRSRKGECQSAAKYIEKWGDEICRLTEAELVGSNWIIHNNNGPRWSHEGCAAGIAADLEPQILGQLLDELVDQFANLPMKNQNL